MHDHRILKQINQAKWTLEARHNVGRVESYPSLLTITALDRCNYRCIMCTHQDHKSTKQISAEALAQIAKILPHVSDVCITGGEPLLYEHLDEFLSICHQGQCAPIVQTNGSLLLERQRRMLIRSGVAMVKLSCDGATPETYNRIRRGGNFLNVFNNIRKLNELKAARGVRHPIIEFNFVAMRSNIEELVPLTLLASKIGVAAINVFLLMAENEEMARESLYFYPDLADMHFLRAVDAGQRFGVQVFRPPLFSEATVCAEQATGEYRCDAPWRGMTVNVDGSVAICCGGAGLAGNLNTDTIDEVWNHPRRRKVRETVNTENELPCCRNCRQGRPVPNSVSAHIPNPELARQTLEYFGRPG